MDCVFNSEKLNQCYNKTKIKNFKMKYVKDFTNWQKIEDLRFAQYDFRYLKKPDDYIRWFNYISEGLRKRAFVIEYEEKNVGYIALRDIKHISRTSTLAIAINAKYHKLGIGTVALRKFFDYYFKKMRMRVLNLDVSNFNKAAIKAYERSGFNFVEEKLTVFENNRENFDLILRYDDFTVKDGKLYTTTSRYTIDKEIYQKIIERKD